MNIQTHSWTFKKVRFWKLSVTDIVNLLIKKWHLMRLVQRLNLQFESNSRYRKCISFGDDIHGLKSKSILSPTCYCIYIYTALNCSLLFNSNNWKFKKRSHLLKESYLLSRKKKRIEKNLKKKLFVFIIFRLFLSVLFW